MKKKKTPRKMLKSWKIKEILEIPKIFQNLIGRQRISFTLPAKKMAANCQVKKTANNSNFFFNFIFPVGSQDFMNFQDFRYFCDSSGYLEFHKIFQGLFRTQVPGVLNEQKYLIYYYIIIIFYIKHITNHKK